ncbi:MAG: class I SAM-dependent methyltransferase [Deltaproteobacteria bacterium]|jgi:SAM-dependent methyltransferase|nr:class I SAM-dependent methyltransferase [Deltaproteobacteria bacterium]
MPNNKPLTETNPVLFWNRKASSFPRFSPGEDNYEASVLKLMVDNGVQLEGKKLLDIGCGTGMFTLRLAKLASHVMAIDIADKMLQILIEDASKNGITNIRAERSDWLSFNLNEEFQVVFCSMTPAIHSDLGRQKLVGLKGATVVTISAKESFYSQIMRSLYLHYGITRSLPRGISSLRPWLEAREIFPLALPIQGVWRVRQSLAEIMESAYCMLENFGLKPEEDELRELLMKFVSEAGDFLEETHYKLEMLIWQNE